jgi:hypothetical protein
MATTTVAATPAPSKADKSPATNGYYVFHGCATSPSRRPTKTKQPTSKSGKCNSSKATATSIAIAGTASTGTTSDVDKVEETVRLSHLSQLFSPPHSVHYMPPSHMYLICPFSFPQTTPATAGTTANGPVYFVPSNGDAAAGGATAVEGGEMFTEGSEVAAVGDGNGDEAAAAGGVLTVDENVVEGNESAAAPGGVLAVDENVVEGNEVAAAPGGVLTVDENVVDVNEVVAGDGNGDEVTAAGGELTVDENAGVATTEGEGSFSNGDEAAAGVSFVGNTTAGEVAKDKCVVEAEGAAAGTTVEVGIEYYATMLSGNDPLPILDYNLAKYVAHDMFSCATERQRRLLLSSNPIPLRRWGRALGEGDCVGVNSVPDETSTGECGFLVEEGQSCTAVAGGVSLVVSDSAATESAENRAIDSINTAFDSGVFTTEDSEYYVAGLVALQMKPAAVEVPAATAGTTISSKQAAEAPISAAGAAVLSLGLIAFIALALMAIRHKRKRDSAYDEFDDDDLDLAAKDTSSTDGSLDDILRDLDYAYGNQVDVHHCTSAMCRICNGQQTTFIEVGDNDTVTEAYPEEFEIGDKQRSFEYMTKPGVSSPRFDNPANIRPRLYEVEDTVDL